MTLKTIWQSFADKFLIYQTDDPILARKVYRLSVMTFGLFIASLVISLVNLLFALAILSEIAVIIAPLACLFGYGLVRLGYIQLAGVFMVMVVGIISLTPTFDLSDIGSEQYVSLTISVLLSGLFLGHQAMFIVVIVVSIMAFIAEEKISDSLTIALGYFAIALVAYTLIHEQRQVRKLSDILFKLSQDLLTVSSEQELLQILIQPKLQKKVVNVALLYFDLDKYGHPVGIESVASWQNSPTTPFPIQTRQLLADFPLAELWMTDSKQPLLLTDVATNNQLQPTQQAALLKDKVLTQVVIPLVQGRHWLGLLVFNWHTNHHFTEHEMAIYQTLPVLITPIIANQRLVSGLEQRVAQRTEALREYRHHLEDMVSDRTQRLAVIAQLSGQLNAILDLDKLLIELVNQVKTSFGFYHAHVYLLNETSGDLELAAGSGEIGQTLKQQRYQRIAGQGIEGQVAETNRHYLCNNIANDANFIPNPLLPNTKSELAMPLHINERVLGVLAIQSERVNRFTQEDVSMVQTIADQTAIAIDNAILLAEKQATIQQLQALDQLKTDFLTSMSHELRTPLNAILGFTEILLEGIDGELPELAHNDLKLIRSNGEMLLTILNDILDISRIEAGLMEIFPRPLAVAETITDVFSIAQSLVRGKQIDLSLDVAPNLRHIYADRLRLKQTLINIISNAIKFTKQGEVKIIVGQDDHDETFIKFRIIDTGIGISKEKQDVIFQSFKQADMTKTREYGGTGLGLAISKQLVEMHGGDIGLVSEEGAGAEFWFTVPNVKNVG
ncbi:ATP-binding protein [Anaerolineales bacterium HSG24]|nr:ATP-binding protein [Anaerolineales bacterium HSG24]